MPAEQPDFRHKQPGSGQLGAAREGVTDYSAMLNFIRADQDTRTFVTDLRDNKTHLRAMIHEIDYEPRSALDEKRGVDACTLPGSTRTVSKAMFAESQSGSNDNVVYRMVASEYLKFVLEQHVFDNKPYIRLDPELEPDQIEEMRARVEERERHWSKFVTNVASGWLETHPDSEAAKAVSMLGFYAFPDQHQRLLQETWPHLLPILTSRSEKNV